jgi:hypothetical protein
MYQSHSYDHYGNQLGFTKHHNMFYYLMNGKFVSDVEKSKKKRVLFGELANINCKAIGTHIYRMAVIDNMTINMVKYGSSENQWISFCFNFMM